MHAVFDQLLSRIQTCVWAYCLVITADWKVGKSTELTSPLFDTERQDIQWQKIMDEKHIDRELEKAERTSFEQ